MGERAPEERREEGRRTVFSLSRGGGSVARVDPHVAMLHTERFHRSGEIEEEYAPRFAVFDELKTVASKTLELLYAFKAYATPWPVANEGFLQAINSIILSLERASRPNTPQPDVLDRERFSQWLAEYIAGINAFETATRVAVMTAATVVSMAMPAHVRSNKVNEEAAGISVVK